MNNLEKINKTIQSLKNNNMNGYYVENKEELFSTIKSLVVENSLVAFGGSQTLKNLGVLDFLREGNYDLLDRYKDGLSKEDIKNLYRKAFTADVYFSSSNAITEDGYLYNVDKLGNRVSAMIYGPDKVIIICGVNKIVKNVQEAIERNRSISAPLNAVRLNTNTPCKTTGHCTDCNSPDKLCCDFTLIKSQMFSDRIHVIFLNDNLGY